MTVAAARPSSGITAVVMPLPSMTVPSGIGTAAVSWIGHAGSAVGVSTATDGPARSIPHTSMAA